MRFEDCKGDYVIFGAGGLAREIWGWIKNSAFYPGSGKLIAFVDDNPNLHGSYDGIPVVGRESLDAGRVFYVNALGRAQSRKAVAESLAMSDWVPLTYVHESVFCGVNVSIGDGVVVCPRSTLSSDCILGDHVLVNGACGVGHDVSVGRYSVLLGSVSLNGNVTVGEEVTLGAGSLVHPGRRIGNGAVIGMASAVFTHVKPGVTVLGNPAKTVHY